MSSAIPSELWFVVLLRDDFRCKNCNGEEGLQPAHIIAKSISYALRLDPKNIVTLCGKCHIKNHNGQLFIENIEGHFFFKEVPGGSGREI
jgi:hypothetical protein